MRSPACRDGKHPNCDRATWDAKRDEEIPDSCGCTCHTTPKEG